MKFVFSDQSFPLSIVKSLFLAGPSPRTRDQFDWRHNAIAYLKSINYDGTVFIPVPEKYFWGADADDASWSYDFQIDWEKKARHLADIILFWIPREIDYLRQDLGMPAFTTNVEYGRDLYSGKIVYGRPNNAVKCRYLDELYNDIKKTPHSTLEATIQEAVDSLGEGALREDGEVYVPLFIWNTEQFQSWYTNLKSVGNRLVSAKLLHHMKFSNNFVFCYTLSVNIWVEAEQRFKSNEFVFSRTDISSVVAYHTNETTKKTKIVLVKEFRSPVNNNKGFVYELPGGSAAKPGVDPKENASHELAEEAGLHITDLNRFKYVGQRQLVATLSTHQSQVYSIALTREEMEHLEEEERKNSCFGLIGDSEMTYLVIASLDNIFTYSLDYSMLGMIYETINGLSIECNS